MILILIILAFFIPLPLYLEFKYKSKKFHIYIYKFNVYTNKNIHKKNNYSIKFYYNIIKNIFKKYIHFNSKPILKLSLKSNYGFENPSITAIFFGIINGLIPNIYNLFSSIFKIKKFKTNIKPIFNNKIFELEIQSILFINLAKIIFISVLVYLTFKGEKKTYLNSKEMN